MDVIYLIFLTRRPVAVPAGHELDAPHPGVPGQLHQDVQQGWIYRLEERSTKGEHSIKMFNRDGSIGWKERSTKGKLQLRICTLWLYTVKKVSDCGMWIKEQI